MLKKLSWYNEKQAYELSESNINLSIILFIAAMLYAVTSIITTIVMGGSYVRNGVNMWRYCTILSLWSFSGLAYGLYIKLNTHVNTLSKTLVTSLRNLDLYYSMSFYFILTNIYMIYADFKTKPLLVFGILLGVYSLLAKCNPIFISAVYLFQYFIIVRYVIYNIGRAEAIISAVYVIIHCLLVYNNAVRMKIDFGYKQELEDTNTEITSKYITQLKINNYMQESTITKLADLIEMRDGETGEHTKRTSSLVRLIAQKLVIDGYYTDILTDDYINIMSQMSMLHDIGKIKIPDSILNAPRALTKEEFEVMKLHTIYGKDIIHDILLDSSDHISKQIGEEIALYHHERWDGRGYPKGLYMNNIPLHARIMSIADVFDALISKRCYKEAISYKEALDIIRSLSGSYFEPKIVDAFLDMSDDIIKISANLNGDMTKYENK